MPTHAGGRASRRLPPARSHFSVNFRQQQRLGAAVAPLARSQPVSVISTRTISATLHLEAGPIPLEADCMKFSTFTVKLRVRPQTHRLIFVNLGTKLP